MKITREINGQMVEIELTEQEVENAHYEHVDKCDLEDCETVFKEVYEHETWLNRLLKSGEPFKLILNQMRVFYQREKYHYDVDWWDAAASAARHRTVVEMIEKFKKGEPK